MRNQPLFRTLALCCTELSTRSLGIESSQVTPFCFLSVPPSENYWMDWGMGEAREGKGCVVKLQHKLCSSCVQFRTQV